MKLMLEFDETMQPAELTLSQLTAKINAFTVEHEINSLQIHEVRRTKSRRLDEAFLTWGEGEMTEEHIALLMAILAAQFGLVGYTNPIPTSYAFGGGGVAATGGLVLATTLPYTDYSDVLAELLYANLGGQPTTEATGLRAEVGGNVLTSTLTPNPWPGDPYYLNGVILKVSIRRLTTGVLPVLTIPKAAAITVKDAAGTSLVLPSRTKDIVATVRAGFPSVQQWYWLDGVGRLYFAYSIGDAVISDSNAPLSFDTAAQQAAW